MVHSTRLPPIQVARRIHERWLFGVDDDEVEIPENTLSGPFDDSSISYT